eukprot:scaffold4279_cov99-Isochrysis_galbana.AAC.4
MAKDGRDTAEKVAWGPSEIRGRRAAVGVGRRGGPAGSGYHNIVWLEIGQISSSVCAAPPPACAAAGTNSRIFAALTDNHGDDCSRPHGSGPHERAGHAGRRFCPCRCPEDGACRQNVHCCPSLDRTQRRRAMASASGV